MACTSSGTSWYHATRSRQPWRQRVGLVVGAERRVAEPTEQPHHRQVDLAVAPVRRRVDQPVRRRPDRRGGCPPTGRRAAGPAVPAARTARRPAGRPRRRAATASGSRRPASTARCRQRPDPALDVERRPSRRSASGRPAAIRCTRRVLVEAAEVRPGGAVERGEAPAEVGLARRGAATDVDPRQHEPGRRSSRTTSGTATASVARRARRPAASRSNSPGSGSAGSSGTAVRPACRRGTPGRCRRR